LCLKHVGRYDLAMGLLTDEPLPPSN
jgi:hypothetical protein